MAGNVFFSVSMSLDGFIAPASPWGIMGQQWMELQQWIFPTRSSGRPEARRGRRGRARQRHRAGDVRAHRRERDGQAHVRRRRRNVAGRGAVPSPVFVVTHEKRDPWERPGGTNASTSSTTASRLCSTRPAPRPPAIDVRIAGGGETILEFVNAGLINEFSIALSPVLFGSGIRLFEGVDTGRVALDPVRRRVDAAGDPPDLRRPGAVTVPGGSWSGRRESNPRSQLGKLMFCR